MKKILALVFMMSIAFLAFAEQRYIIEFELKQSHLTLDLFEHAKDAMNAITFELPVDKTFYDSVEEGDVIVKKFRSGSLIINGSFGNWKMTVHKKRIQNT